MHITKNRTTQLYLVIAVFILITAAWELLVRVTDMPAFTLPAPSSIAKRFVALLSSSHFWADTWVTLSEILLGFGVSVIIAIIFGVLISQFLVLELSLLPYVIGFQAIPSIALAPIYVTWFGYGMASKIVMAVTIASFPIMMMVIAGLQASSAEQIQMLRSFGATRLQILLKVKVPNALPFFFTGLKLGIIMAVTGAIVAEFQGAQAGLGLRTLQYYNQAKTADAFATLTALALMSIILHGITGRIKSKIVFWTNPHGGFV